MQRAIITTKSVDKIKKGNPLMTEMDFVSTATYNEGTLLSLYDAQQQFVAKAIVGKQNKGLAWVVTTNANQEIDRAFFEKLLQRAKQKRDTSDVATKTSAYRLFNAESDGLGGLTIDLYGSTALFSWYSAGLYCYAQDIIQAFQNIFNVTAIYEKQRYETAAIQSRFVSGVDQQQFTICENDVTYAVDMNDGLMTGIFLDQRDVRAYLKQHAANKSVLNTFSYTGAFSLAAAKGGASQSVSVDVAKRSLEKTQEQFALNDIDMANHAIYIMDVFDYMKYAKKKGLLFDWVVLDPPSFARTKKRTFSVVKDYGALLQDAIDLTDKKGRILISTNSASFSVKDFEKMIDGAFKQKKRAYRIEQKYQLPSDFTVLKQLPMTSYLKVYIVECL